MSCRSPNSSHHPFHFLALQLLLLHSDAAHRSRLAHGAPLYTARHPPGPGPVTGRPVTSRLAWADSDTGAAHPAQADSDPLPVSSLPGSGRLGSPAEHTAQADSDPASSRVTCRRPQRLHRAGPCPPACLLATLRQAQLYKVPRRTSMQGRSTWLLLRQDPLGRPARMDRPRA